MRASRVPANPHRSTEMRACQSVTPRVRYRCADRTPIADSVLVPRGDMRRKRVVMRVAGVSHADRAQSWPGVGRAVRVCNRPSVRGRCAPGQRRDRLNGDAKRGWRRLLLVTSANHMRRAVALFQKQGFEVTPVPCNFLTNVSTAPSPQALCVPSWGGFEKIAVWLHEEVGWLEYRRRGWISVPP